MQGRQFGFDGKTLIHPSQLEPANRLFAPSPSEVEHAQAVIAAFDEATTQGKGVATVNGKLIENLHVADAHRILAVAKAAGIVVDAAPLTAIRTWSCPPSSIAVAEGTDSKLIPDRLLVRVGHREVVPC